MEINVDVHTSPKLKYALKRLTNDAHYNLVVNLEKVDYIDSTGLSVLVGVLKGAGDQKAPGCCRAARPGEPRDLARRNA